MVKVLLVAGLLVVVAGLWFVRGSAVVPDSASQFAPPPTPASGEVMVELTEATLSERMNDRLAGQPLGDTPLGKATLTRLTTQLKPNQLVANGDADVGGRSVPVTLTGHVDMESGRPLAVVSDASAAGVPLPSATRASLSKILQDQVDQEIARLKMKVKSISITQGKILIIGTRTA
jgi:hypothetical protein